MCRYRAVAADDEAIVGFGVFMSFLQFCGGYRVLVYFYEGGRKRYNVGRVSRGTKFCYGWNVVLYCEEKLFCKI